MHNEAETVCLQYACHKAHSASHSASTVVIVSIQDMQGEKLKEQLRNTLMERKREAKKAFDMAGAFRKDAASRPASRVGRKGDDNALKVNLDRKSLHYPSPHPHSKRLHTA